MPDHGLLVVMTDIAPELEDEFNRWYDQEHLPQQLSLPGFLSARRYRVLQGEPKYIALYDLASVHALETPEYQRAIAAGLEASPLARKIAAARRIAVRGVYQHLLTLPDPEPTDLSAARALLIAGIDNLEPSHEEEFRDWYNTEHLPRLSGTPGVIRARRFELWAEAPNLVGNPDRYMATYDLERPEVPASEEWLRRRNTPWTARIQRFHSLRRWVCERIA